MTTDNLCNKRSSEFTEIKPSYNNNAWPDFVYSSPNSPQLQLQQQQQQPQPQQVQEPQELGFDLLFNNQYGRRHSVSLGEMSYRLSENKPWNQDNFDQMLGSPLPSSWSSSSSSNMSQSHNAYNNNSPTEPVFINRRAMSLRVDTPIQPHNTFMDHRSSISTASPSTPAFFSPSFMDALKQEDDLMIIDNFNQSDMNNTDCVMSNKTTSATHPVTATTTTTITPSVINTNDVNNWFLNNDSQQIINNHHHQPIRKSSASSLTNASNDINGSSPPMHQYNSPNTPSPPSASSLMTYHPSIPEETEDESEESVITEQLLLQQEKTTYQNQITSRIIQGNQNARIMKSLIAKYLATSENERTIMILTSKVAQKSYGTEKRFLCPPPSTVLSGSSWFTHQPDAPPKLTVRITGEKTSQNGVIEWKTPQGATFDPAKRASTDRLIGNCVSKQLHINDADEKRKRVEILVKVNLANGNYLGTFASKDIKVISKPSKKRQSVKNMELCIHHGTTVSLFNRIRSQTVSTKYLGVSTEKSNSNQAGTCFVARTGSWDPFVIWIVDTSQPPSQQDANSTLLHHPDNPHFPPPPAIALKLVPGQATIALHYNQPIVLQCVSTGLVSPVMVIRKVDKGSMIMGGNRLDDLSGPSGGECGDEALGDPVSQLHKIAFQIVQDPSIAHYNKTNRVNHQPGSVTEWTLPQADPQAVSYLACLDDVVGMHKTSAQRQFILPRPIPPSILADAMHHNWQTDPSSFDHNGNFDILSQLQQLQQQQHSDLSLVGGGGGKMASRKRRVSCDTTKQFNTIKPSSMVGTSSRRRVNSLNDGDLLLDAAVGTGGHRRRSSVSSSDLRRSSIGSDQGYQANGACWTEDVSDASVWTIVGTDCASYKFWTPPTAYSTDLLLNSPFTDSLEATVEAATPITPFPVLSTAPDQLQYSGDDQILNLVGGNFTRDVSVWFGEIRSPRTTYKSSENLECTVPDLNQLISSQTMMLDNEAQQRKIPLLFVRGDGVVYNTDMFFMF